MITTAISNIGSRTSSAYPRASLNGWRRIPARKLGKSVSLSKVTGIQSKSNRIVSNVMIICRFIFSLFYTAALIAAAAYSKGRDRETVEFEPLRAQLSLHFACQEEIGCTMDGSSRYSE